jgi:hypothetical protein
MQIVDTCTILNQLLLLFYDKTFLFNYIYAATQQMYN